MNMMDPGHPDDRLNLEGSTAGGAEDERQIAHLIWAPDGRYVKTEAGRSAIQQRTHQLSRPVRNLLLILDDRHSALGWLQLVQGVTQADVLHLLKLGLIEPKAQPAVEAVATADVLDPASQAVFTVLDQLSQSQIYDVLTREARERLGLIRGYRFVLEVEKADGLAALRQLALSFVAQVREQQGPEAAQAVMQQLTVGA